MKELYTRDYLLDRESIDKISEEVYQIFSDLYTSKAIKNGHHKALSIRIQLEEALLTLMDCAGQEKKICHVSIDKRMSTYVLSLDMEGSRTTAFQPKEMDEFDARLDAYAPDEMSTKYTYSNGRNLVAISIKIKKISTLKKTLGAIGLAILFSLALELLPGDTAQSINTLLIAPLLADVMAVFSLTAMTMIFFNIMVGIGNLNSVRFFKRTGSTIVRYALIRDFITIVVSTIIFVLVYGIFSDNFDFSLNVLEDLSDLVFGILPTNIINPFATKNALQIMLLGMFCGITLLVLGDKTPDLKKNLSQLNIFSMKAVSLACKMTPLMIFLSITKLILSGKISMIRDCWQLFLMQIGLCLLYAICSLIYISKHTEYSIGELLKNAMPSIITGFSTGSSTSCIYQNIELLTNKYKVEDDKVAIIQPIFQMFFEPPKAISLVGYAMFACAQAGVTLSIIQIIVFMLIVMLSVISAPPVNGGLLVVLSILMISIGLPDEAMELAIGVDALISMIRIGFKQSYYSAEILLISKRI